MGKDHCSKCGQVLSADHVCSTDIDEPSKASVQKELEELKSQAKSFTMEDIKGGAWFASFLRYVLEAYAKKVDAAYFRRKYPNLPRDAVIDRQIALAKRYAAIEGALSAGAYTAAVAATIGTAGGASPLTIPAGVSSFVVDLLYTTRLQLHLAYDISVLYGYPVDLEDPTDLFDLVKVAFGVKAGELLRGSLSKVAPEAVRVGVKRVATGATLQVLKALPVIGKYLLQRNIIKFCIPVIGVALSAGLNYWSTGSIARVARQVYRDKAAAHEQGENLAAGFADDSALLLKVLWMVIWADRDTAPEEAWLLNELTEALNKSDDGRQAVEAFRSFVDLSIDQVLSDVQTRSTETKAALFDAACMAAAVDHQIQKEERTVLKRLAECCGVPFDEKRLVKMAKAGIVS